MAEWKDTWETDRHKPLPSVLEVPGHLWRLLGRRGHIAVGVLAAVLVVLAVLLVPGAVDNGNENRVNSDLERAAALSARRAQLARLQRPHLSELTGAAAADVRRPAAVRSLERSVSAGLSMPASCEPSRAHAYSASDATFSCLASEGAKPSGNYKIQFGQRARARIRSSDSGATATVAWCRDFPRPLHPETEEFVTVPVAGDCEGPPASG